MGDLQITLGRSDTTNTGIKISFLLIYAYILFMGMGRVLLTFVFDTLPCYRRYIDLMFKEWLLASRRTSPRYGPRFTLPPDGVSTTELICWSLHSFLWTELSFLCVDGWNISLRPLGPGHLKISPQWETPLLLAVNSRFSPWEGPSGAVPPRTETQVPP